MDHSLYTIFVLDAISHDSVRPGRQPVGDIGERDDPGDEGGQARVGGQQLEEGGEQGGPTTREEHRAGKYGNTFFPMIFFLYFWRTQEVIVFNAANPFRIFKCSAGSPP